MHEESSVADRNVERLLSQAYQPESPPADLLRRVQERMRAARPVSPPTTAEQTRLVRLRYRLAGAMSVAAAAAAIFLAIYAWQLRSTSGNLSNRSPHADEFAQPKEILTPQPRTSAKTPETLGVGRAFRTEAGQRRRVALPDGSILYINQKTEVKLDANRRLTLRSGEVFVEVAPRQKTGERFLVITPKGAATALGTKFAVQANAQGTGVIVTQGKVRFNDLELTTGQRVKLGTRDIDAAPRASYVLDWTRELMAAAESPLVPGSKYAGGALIAKDPDGQEAKLTLRNYTVDVHIEDGFARTVIDQTYFNQNHWRMEGTFYFPLPADASLSRLAMYVDGNLMEGGMAERDHARNVYEEIVYSQRDPALLEWVDGSTFKMRVFPLESRQEKRILIAYTQRLSSLYGRTQYRFPTGHSLGLVNQFQFRAHVKDGQGRKWNCDSHQLRHSSEGNDLLLLADERHAQLDRDVVLDLAEPTPTGDAARFSTTQHEGNRYVMLRYRPQLAVQQQRQTRDWVFLFESSGDRDPLLARVQIDVLRSLLTNAEHGDTFAIVTADTRTHVFAEHPMPATPENIKAAIEFLEGTHLIGALNLRQALAETERFLQAGPNPHLVHLGSGIAALGERRPEVLAGQIPAGTRYVGIGIGKRWSRDFMKTAAERSGGYFTQINPDEPVSWRAFELSATLNTPRLMDVKIAGNGRTPFLAFGSTLAQGEELCAVARFQPGEATPSAVTITGTLDGRTFEERIPLPSDLTSQPPADYLPRTWAKLEIERLLAGGAQEHKKEIIDLSKQMYVMTPFTSLLVLENEDMYKRFQVDRGRKDHWAMYQSPQKIPVVYEPEVGQPVDARFAPKTAKPHANQILETILVRVPAPILTWPNRQNRYGGQWIVTALQVYHGAFAAPMGGNMGNAAEPLASDDIGNDPDLPGNFNVDRIEELSAAVHETRMGSLMFNGADRLMPGGFGGRSDVMPGPMSMPMLRNAAKNRTFLSAAVPRVEKRRTILTEQLERQVFGADALYDQRMRRANTTKSIRKQLLEQSFRQMKGEGESDGKNQRGEDADLRLLQLANGQMQAPPMYGRPAFSNDERVFFDLVSYAPGMTTSQADVDAAVEAEALPKATGIPGQIDPEARRLIDAARAGGWQTLHIGDQAITFDGQGRYAYERNPPSGLREQVVCDGQTLWHLYPELGIGAKRTVSRFHRRFLAERIPWLVPPAEDLARGANLRKVGENVVAIVPRGAEEARELNGKRLPYKCMKLVLGNGQLLERQIVRVVPEKKEENVLYRETYGPAAGQVKWFNAKGNELSKREWKLTASPAPNLVPDTSKLVVLPLPYRARHHGYAKAGVERGLLFDHDMGWTLEYLDSETALALFAAEFTANDWHGARQIYRRCFAANGVSKPGFFALLASIGMNVAADPDFLALVERDPGHPLLGFLAVNGNPVYRHWHQQYGLYFSDQIGPKGCFLQRLAAFHDLYPRWQFNRVNGEKSSAHLAEEKRALAFVRENKSAFGWALLTVLQDHAGHPDFRRAIAKACQTFDDTSDLAYVARYERARSLFQAGNRAEAANLFATLYEKRFAEGVLPPIDHDFRHALLNEGDRWTTLMRQTAETLRKDNDRQAMIDLAWQCWQLGDAPLAENIQTAALASPKDNAERLKITAAAVEYLMATNQLAEADDLLAPLLNNAAFNQRAMLWRVGARIAQQRNLTAAWVHRLEQALEIEYRKMPEMVNLQQVRGEYGQLLNHYQWLAGAVATMNIKPPEDLLARTVKAADRWRALDHDNPQPCDSAAMVLGTLGARDLAWDYLTTPIGLKPNEGQPWQNLASRLSYQGELELANRAYQAAFEAEPTDAQILWQQAQNLRQTGKVAESRAVLRQIVQGDWQPRFNWIKSQARWQLEGR